MVPSSGILRWTGRRLYRRNGSKEAGMHALQDMMQRDDFAEARALAALHLVQLAMAAERPTDSHQDSDEDGA